MKFKIPAEIKLSGATIKIIYDPNTDFDNSWGCYRPSENKIVLNDRVSPDVLFESFIHEISEVLADRFVNQDEGGAESGVVPHRVRDAYGRGIYNFLMDNLYNMIEGVE